MSTTTDQKPAQKRKKTKKIIPQKLGEDEIDKTPPLPGFNLAGRPESLKTKEGGLKRNEIKAVGPYHTNNVNTDTYWHFVIRSSKNEWIRFKPDSISILLFGTYDNPNYEEGNAVPRVAAQRHALRSGEAVPSMHLDPSVLGTGFVDRVDVSINNVPVPTNTAMGKLLLHYVRMARIFNTKPGPMLTKNTSINRPVGGRNALRAPMATATTPFDYYTWNSTTGQRVPIFLDGIFPFDIKNRTIESIDRASEPNLFFPPDTEISVKVHVHPGKLEAVFHDGVTMANYFVTNENADRPAGHLALTIQEVTLEYESAELMAAEHVKALKQYVDGGLGIYDYDIVRGQNQPLNPNSSFTITSFQVMPQARLAYILFLPDHATFVQEATRKPMSALSRFPENSAKLAIEFAGEKNIITPYFENFGHVTENHQISKKIYYDYLVRNRMTKCEFDEFFPRSENEFSLIQCFVLDLKTHMSERTELLNITSTFSGGQSPDNCQVVCITVHPNGRATCRSSGTQFEWIWSFSQLA
jgi:hypothetical protein